MDKTIMKKKIKRPPFERLYPYLVFLFIGYCVADLAMIPVRGYMLPTQVPPARAPRLSPEALNSRGNYNDVVSRNIFSSDGTIPDTLASKAKKQNGGDEQKDAAPVPSSLPLNLMGTIVHSNPEKSIANIEIKNKNTVVAVRVGKAIDTIATLVSVERGKIIIRNTNNQRLEYIELKSLSKLSFNSTAKTAAGDASKEVKQVAQNKFEINRADVLKYTADMSSVLQQAAMQPHRKSNGEIDGFKFLNIQPNSIYSQLGFQIGDTIKAVNGEPVDSPAKAMELYQTLKGSNTIKIMVERNGHDQENEYNVK